MYIFIPIAKIVDSAMIQIIEICWRNARIVEPVASFCIQFRHASVWLELCVTFCQMIINRLPVRWTVGQKQELLGSTTAGVGGGGA